MDAIRPPDGWVWRLVEVLEQLINKPIVSTLCLAKEDANHWEGWFVCVRVHNVKFKVIELPVECVFWRGMQVELKRLEYFGHPSLIVESQSRVFINIMQRNVDSSFKVLHLSILLIILEGKETESWERCERSLLSTCAYDLGVKSQLVCRACVTISRPREQALVILFLWTLKIVCKDFSPVEAIAPHGIVITRPFGNIIACIHNPGVSIGTALWKYFKKEVIEVFYRNY
jgi:hypothetical protein